ncbi:MAG: TIGR02186 family protein [Acidobacteriota bacterium]
MRAPTLLPVLLFPLLSAAAPPPAVTVRAYPPEIRMSAGYHGASVAVRGRVPPGCEVAVILSSPLAGEAWPRRSKHGPFWITTGAVRFEGVPWLYQIRTSRPLAELLPPSRQAALGLGAPGLKATVGVRPSQNRDLYIEELIRARSAAGFYDLGGGGLTLSPSGEFRTAFTWPASAPPGRYEVKALALREGHRVGEAALTIRLRKVGAEAWISDLAARHAWLYGLLSVLVAVLAGLAAGWLFRAPGTRKATG